jgi:sialidase-1
MKIAAFTALIAAGLVSQPIIAAEPELAGHWKLDDKAGGTVADSSAGKNPGKIVAQPGRTTGRFGGAFTFNGKDSYVEIPNSKELDQIQNGSYSIAAWFKPETAPPGADDAANDAGYGIVMKTGWHEGLSYTRQKQFVMTHWIQGDADPVWMGTGTWNDEFAPGEWYHLVGVVDQNERVAKLYVNGELKATTDPWNKGAKTKDYERETWKIGVAGPGNDRYAWFAKGAVGDVRIYKGTLTDSQVTALYEAGTKGK